MRAPRGRCRGHGAGSEGEEKAVEQLQANSVEVWGVGDGQQVQVTRQESLCDCVVASALPWQGWRDAVDRHRDPQEPVA